RSGSDRARGGVDADRLAAVRDHLQGGQKSDPGARTVERGEDGFGPELSVAGDPERRRGVGLPGDEHLLVVGGHVSAYAWAEPPPHGRAPPLQGDRTVLPAERLLQLGQVHVEDDRTDVGAAAYKRGRA